MKRVFLFAGTSEGRHLAKLLSAAGVACTVSVATEYGAETMLQDAPELYGTRILQGRMTHAEMCTAFADAEAALVVDATHPFATKVSEEIRFACAESGLTYLRLARNTADASADGSGMRVFDNADDALSFLNEREGNILFLTGSRDIRSFAAAIDDRSRVFARVLPSAESIAACTEAGLSGKQIFAMQGPFSEEMNLAMLKRTGAKFLLTKETGSAGGFPEKLAAARKASVTAVVIANPEARDTGEKYDFEEMCAVLSGRLGVSLAAGERVLTLAGIGPGAPEMMTLAVREAIGNAEVLFGAPRMTEGAAAIAPHAAIVKEYKEEAVHAYLQAHPEVRRAVLLYSGDVGIYSGAAKMHAPEGWRLEILPGISSLVYFCAKLHTPWQDAKILSLHGRDCNVVGQVAGQEKCLLLLTDEAELRTVLASLYETFGDAIRADFGYQLSCPEEVIGAVDFTPLREAVQRGTEDVRAAAGQIALPGEGLYLLLIRNGAARDFVLTPGLPDASFLRAEHVPMTKEEVRTLSLSKLRLTKGAVLYDIGAGTGSVSVEAARLVPEGRVFAVEQKEAACAQIERNRRRFGLENLTVVHATAPEGLRELPAPTHVFLGGTDKRLGDILQAVREKTASLAGQATARKDGAAPGGRDNKGTAVRVVINCVTLETLTEAQALLAESGTEAEVVQVSVSRARKLGSYHLMQAENPVYIISFEMEGSA